VAAADYGWMFQAPQFLCVAPATWFVIRTANRYYYAMKDFPPHRHINGKIMYPRGLEPPVVEALEARTADGPPRPPTDWLRRDD
jgi:hypothetical protein